MKNKYDRLHMPFGNAFAVADELVINCINNIDIDTDIISDPEIHTKFLKSYKDWILTTKNNSIRGLEKYQYACFSNGTTETFDKFYSKHKDKRFRFFKGEYLYHRLSCRNYNLSWAYLDDERLNKGDVVIISLPFSDTGNAHEEMDEILESCNRLNIPVLLDCAYFGVCKNINFDFNHNCIEEIAFSLSKSLFSAHLRIGMRLTKIDDDDPLFVTNKVGYVNRLSAYIGHELLKEFSPDYIYNKYSQRQNEICNLLGVTPSNCVLFGIGGEKWNEYNRDRKTNRLSFHKFLHQSTTEEIKGIIDEKR